MPDISMCLNECCNLKTSCYRFMATPSPFNQAYTLFKPKIVDGFTTCKDHMELKANVSAHGQADLTPVSLDKLQN